MAPPEAPLRRRPGGKTIGGAGEGAVPGGPGPGGGGGGFFPVGGPAPGAGGRATREPALTWARGGGGPGQGARGARRGGRGAPWRGVPGGKIFGAAGEGAAPGVRERGGGWRVSFLLGWPAVAAGGGEAGQPGLPRPAGAGGAR